MRFIVLYFGCMDKVQQAIGKRIRGARNQAGLKQQEVADAVNMTRSNYQKIESGYIGVNNPTLIKLAELFNVKTDQLLIDNYVAFSSSHAHDDGRSYRSAEVVENELLLKEKVQLLEQSIEDNEIISLKEEIIEVLREKLKKLETKK